MGNNVGSQSGASSFSISSSSLPWMDENFSTLVKEAIFSNVLKEPIKLYDPSNPTWFPTRIIDSLDEVWESTLIRKDEIINYLDTANPSTTISTTTTTTTTATTPPPPPPTTTKTTTATTSSQSRKVNMINILIDIRSAFPNSLMGNIIQLKISIESTLETLRAKLEKKTKVSPSSMSLYFKGR